MDVPGIRRDRRRSRRGRSADRWSTVVPGRPGRRGLAVAVIGAAVAGAAVLVARAPGRQAPRAVRRVVTVNRPVGEVFAFWEDLGNLPRFMTHLQQVERLDDQRSRWRAKAPGGRTVSWESEITDHQPGRLIAWRALQPAAVPHTGQVAFAAAPGGRGTEIHVNLSYRPPGGRAGVALARLAGQEPDQQVREDLRRLKQILECGQVVTVHGQPSARSRLGRRLTALADRRARTGGRP